MEFSRFSLGVWANNFIIKLGAALAGEAASFWAAAAGQKIQRTTRPPFKRSAKRGERP